MTQEEINSQLANNKAKLWCQMGDPNRHQTWLEDLADAQAQAHGTTPKKWLKQLIQTEEQQTHARQIKHANHMLWGGGLAKVMKTMAEGQQVDHYLKETIKQACLEEAWAQFTQANDMPFLTEPLLSDLGILGMDKTQFDNIAARTYHHLTPQIMPNDWYHYSCNQLRSKIDHKLSPKKATNKAGQKQKKLCLQASQEPTLVITKLAWPTKLSTNYTQC